MVEFWKEIESHVFQKVGLSIQFSELDKHFGYHIYDQNRTPLNVLILVTKKYIYDTNLKNGFLSLTVLKQKLFQTFEDELYLARLVGKEVNFLNQWAKWQPLLVR